MSEKHTPAPRGADNECKGRAHVAPRAPNIRKQHVDALMGMSQRFVARIEAMPASVADDAEQFFALHEDWNYLLIALVRMQKPWISERENECDESLKEAARRLEDAWTAFHSRCFPGDA